MELSFGEQVKILLKRQNLTIKDLANLISEYTGKPMSRQNLTQKLARDNFQEQDMRLISHILGYNFAIMLTPIVASTPEEQTIEVSTPSTSAPLELPMDHLLDSSFSQMSFCFDDSKELQIVSPSDEPLLSKEQINPDTKEEYHNNTVRVHPFKKHFLQIYEQDTHQWIDVKESEFYRFQERKRQLLGAEYEPPTYL